MARPFRDDAGFHHATRGAAVDANTQRAAADDAHRRAMSQHNAELMQSMVHINEDLHDMCWGKQGCCWSLWGAICSGLTSCCRSAPTPQAESRQNLRTKLLSGTGQDTEKELCVGRIMALNNRNEIAARQFDLISLAPAVCVVIGACASSSAFGVRM
jgi:hypothetical protein